MKNTFTKLITLVLLLSMMLTGCALQPNAPTVTEIPVPMYYKDQLPPTLLTPCELPILPTDEEYDATPTDGGKLLLLAEYIAMVRTAFIICAAQISAIRDWEGSRGLE